MYIVEYTTVEKSVSLQLNNMYNIEYIPKPMHLQTLCIPMHLQTLCIL
jgi:hypothetical protein